MGPPVAEGAAALNGVAIEDGSKMGARRRPTPSSISESGGLDIMTCVLSTYGSPLRTAAVRHSCGMANLGLVSSAIAVKLPGPGDELFPIKAEVLAKLDVRHSIGAGPLVEPA